MQVTVKDDVVEESLKKAERFVNTLAQMVLDGGGAQDCGLEEG